MILVIKDAIEKVKVITEPESEETLAAISTPVEVLPDIPNPIIEQPVIEEVVETMPEPVVPEKAAVPIPESTPTVQNAENFEYAISHIR